MLDVTGACCLSRQTSVTVHGTQLEQKKSREYVPDKSAEKIGIFNVLLRVIILISLFPRIYFYHLITVYELVFSFCAFLNTLYHEAYVNIIKIFYVSISEITD